MPSVTWPAACATGPIRAQYRPAHDIIPPLQPLPFHMSTSGFNFLRRQGRNSTGSGTGNNDNDNQKSSLSITSIPSVPSDLSSDSSADAPHDATESNSNGHGRSEEEEPDNILNSKYAHARRELLELVRDLRALGHDKDLDIPQIAVIGKQSAGKSSLVEAVAGINVPRDAGTCTRCPMECTMLTSSDQWSCSISLRGEGINTAFSPDLTDKSLVELWIRRAQAVVLCPHLDRERFKSMSREQIKEVTDHTIDAEVKKFGNTVVEVKILDPKGTDLVFVDLPGLIPNADDDVVSQVEDMVKQYISLPSTIILVTVPAEDDLENQKAIKLAKEADPHGERTIAVVTKADKIGAGETGRQNSWRDIFAGRAREHKLRLGYYAVRLPTDDERARKITAAQTRAEAARVFDTVAPWQDIKAFPGPTRLGVDALLRDISPLLMRMLVDAIPRLKTAVEHLLVKCFAALADLPARPEMTDTTAELIQLIFKFCQAVKETVDGTGDDKSFVHRSLAHYRTLKSSIRATAPDFRPFENPAAYPRPPEPLSQRREDEFSVPIPVPEPESMPRSFGKQAPIRIPSPFEMLAPVPMTPEPTKPSHKRAKHKGGSSKEPATVGGSMPAPAPRLDVPAPRLDVVTAATDVLRSSVRSDNSISDKEDQGVEDVNQVVMGLLDVRRVIQESTGWELPHNVPYLARTRLIREFIRRWREPSETCFAGIRGVFEEYVHGTLVPQHFDQYPSLGEFVMVQLLENIEGYLSRSQMAVQLVLAREEIPYFTQNGHYLEATREVWLGHYKEVRQCRDFQDRGCISQSSTGHQEAQAIAAIRALPGYSGINETDLPKLLPTDEFNDELTVMADVRSYFQVAYKRVIDNIPQTIHHDFVQGFAYGLQPYLLGKLDLGAKDAPERLEKLLEEDPDVSRMRKYLQDRRERLEVMKTRLNDFRI